MLVGYVVNIQKSITFLYTSSEQMDFGVKNTIIFILAPLKMKYFGVNLTKYMQDLYEENHKILMNIIKKLSKWREFMFII